MIVTDLRPKTEGRTVSEELIRTNPADVVDVIHGALERGPLPVKVGGTMTVTEQHLADTAHLAAPRHPVKAGRTVRCPITVTWVDTGVTCRCLRPTGHDGPHRDGVDWFDDHGLRVPHCEPVESPGRGMRAGHRAALKASR